LVEEDESNGAPANAWSAGVWNQVPIDEKGRRALRKIGQRTAGETQIKGQQSHNDLMRGSQAGRR